MKRAFFRAKNKEKKGTIREVTSYHADTIVSRR
jgi:hypothetical protein